KDLFKKCANRRNAEESVDSASEASFRPTRVPAARLTASNASTRHDINDSVLERVGTTGATPFGRGKSKMSSQNLPGFSEYKHRCDNCLGVPIKIMDLKTNDKGEPSGFQLSKRMCDLCGMRTTTMCIGCKRVLCLDNDRTDKLRELLKDEKKGARIRRDFPALADVRRGNAPSSVCRVGVINNDPIYAVQSCFHHAHPNYFEQCKPAVDLEASLSTPPRRRFVERDELVALSGTGGRRRRRAHFVSVRGRQDVGSNVSAKKDALEPFIAEARQYNRSRMGHGTRTTEDRVQLIAPESRDTDEAFSSQPTFAEAPSPPADEDFEAADGGFKPDDEHLIGGDDDSEIDDDEEDRTELVRQRLEEYLADIRNSSVVQSPYYTNDSGDGQGEMMPDDYSDDDESYAPSDDEDECDIDDEDWEADDEERNEDTGPVKSPNKEKKTRNRRRIKPGHGSSLYNKLKRVCKDYKRSQRTLVDTDGHSKASMVYMAKKSAASGPFRTSSQYKLTVDSWTMRNNLGAAKRLRKELQSLEKSARNGDTSDSDIYLRPASSSSLLDWSALVKGPIDSPYEGGVFRLSIRCGTDYPLSPLPLPLRRKYSIPTFTSRSPPQGDVCLDILKREWSPAWGLLSACRAVLALLSDPDADSPLNCDAGNMIRSQDKLAYWTTAEMYTLENAFFIEWPDDEDDKSK
ncbi:hypothetical protein THAOC_16382, partial [Thalassiosira oceanica]